MKGPSAALSAFHDYEPESEDFAAAVVGGLSKPQKAIPSKYFYDKRGSVLFDRICELPEYYVTRTEIALLRRQARAIASLIGPHCHLVEFGSGSSIKVPILLDALERPAAYTAIDISRQHLLQATAALARNRQGLEVTAVCADYTKPFDLPRPKSATGGQPVVFFPGSTIGNFDEGEAVSFLRGTAALLRPLGGAMLVGVDLQKDPMILHAAYNDSQGITAAFNLNLLVRANRELEANFDLAAFRHLAFYEARRGRIEMHLSSLADQAVRVAGTRFTFRVGETIHT
jgi:dimethylhistidine N-methyltransferase